MEENLSKELKSEIAKQVKEVHDRSKAIADRNAQTRTLHEHIITIQRLDDIQTKTFLEIAEQNITSRRRSSWYGKILDISETPSGDDIIEFKKKQLKIGDIVIFNPGSAYCLNIAGYDELWILHVDNILKIDLAYNYEEAREENIKKKLIIQDEIKRAQDRQNLTRVPLVR